MTKPAAPPPARADVVEIDAMDLAEWESGQSTPQASDANLAELVRRTTAPAQPTGRAQTVARERTRTQIGAPVVERTANQRARTAPPGPAPKPTRPRTAAGGVPVIAKAAGTSAPAIRAAMSPAMAPGVVPAMASTLVVDASPRPGAASAGIDFSLPVTSTGAPDREAPRLPSAPTSVELDFSLPVTSAGEPTSVAPRPSPRPGIVATDFSLPVTGTGEPASAAPRSSARPGTGGSDFSRSGAGSNDFSRSGAGSNDFSRPGAGSNDFSRPGAGSNDFSLPVTGTGDPTVVARRSSPRPGSPGGFSPPASATSESGARAPHAEAPPAPAPQVMTSPFAEPSHIGPGRHASPAGGADPNTAWPPRPIPVDVARQPAGLAGPDAGRALRAGGGDDAGAEPQRLNPGLSRRRLWWIGGAIAAVTIGVIVIAAVSANPELASAPASDGRGHPADRGAARATGAGAAASQAAQDAGAVSGGAGATGRSARTAAAVDPAGRAMTIERTWRLTVGAITGLTDATVGPAKRAAARPGTRRTIVDYSARPNELPPPSLVVDTQEDPAIGQARIAYSTGNQRLFGGDLDGAIRAYHEALALYPGYVGGYRGLGLAYAELGDKASALAALKSYVAAAPTARDVALIKKRIAHLQGK